MGCIKPPLNVTDPPPRGSNRLAFTSNWSPVASRPPDVGVIIDDKGNEHMVSFKVGISGSNVDGHTLIADGDLSDKAAAFNTKKNHNHYGPDSDNPGTTFGIDRGAYSGPDH
jgi:hypothetical protein